MKLLPMTVVLAAMMLPLPAGAQTADAPKVKGFPVVYVTEASGRETKGRIVGWTGSSIVLQTGTTTKSFAEGEAIRIDLKGDSLKNGALIGAGVGVFLGAITGAIGDCEGCHGEQVGFVLVVIGVYAAIGAGIDALIPGRTPLWRAGSSARSGSGLAISVSAQRRSAFVGWKIKR
jgi:hypothetical protein